MARHGWEVSIALALLVVSVLLLEATISLGSLGAGGQGGGLLGPQPPFGGRGGGLGNGEIIVRASISSLCLGPGGNSTGPGIVQVESQTVPPGQNGAFTVYANFTSILPQVESLTFPMQNLSILATLVSSGGGQTTFETNSSGVAEVRVSAGTYSIYIGDPRVNTSLTLDVPSGTPAEVGISSSEGWTPATSYAYSSAGVSGEPLPWDDFTAVFPQLLNYSTGEEAPIIFGALPSCASVQANGAGAYEHLVPLLSIQDRQGGVWTSFPSPTSVGVPIDGVTLVTYTSKYQVGSPSG